MFENCFIAQEVETSLRKPGLPVDGMISKDDKGYYSIRYNDFIPVLVKGMQEQQMIIENLKKQAEATKAEIPMQIGKQQVTIEKQEQKLSDLQKQIAELKKMITAKN